MDRAVANTSVSQACRWKTRWRWPPRIRQPTWVCRPRHAGTRVGRGGLHASHHPHRPLVATAILSRWRTGPGGPVPPAAIPNRGVLTIRSHGSSACAEAPADSPQPWRRRSDPGVSDTPRQHCDRGGADERGADEPDEPGVVAPGHIAQVATNIGDTASATPSAVTMIPSRGRGRPRRTTRRPSADDQVLAAEAEAKTAANSPIAPRDEAKKSSGMADATSR